MDDSSEPREPPGPETLALEYLERRSTGEASELAPWLERLRDEDSRREFLALVQASQRIERALPRAPRPLAREQLVARRYLLVRQLGVGGMGQVWEAQDRELGRSVALKFLDSASQGRAEREELFRKESRLLASLQHPGIVAVHEFGRDGELAFIVMDLVPGRSLAEVLDEVRGQLLARGEAPLPRDARALEAAIRQPSREGRLDLCEGGDWFRAVARIELELARTIEAAHGAKVVHRDLKPSNVMLTAGGNPVVLDFGLAGSSEGLHGAVTQGLYGSVAYLAPEQAKSHAVGTDPRTDVYQLGLVLYEMLTLQRAFPGTAIGEVLERVQHGRFPAPRRVHKHVPRELEAICLRASELHPRRRYQSARELREDLERWLTGRELPHALRAGKLRRALRRVRWHVHQRPWLSLAAGLVLAGAAGYALWGTKEGPLAIQEQALRYDAASGKWAPLTEVEKEVRVGDWIGFELRSNKPVHVWTLSVFGPRSGPGRVGPWHASIPADAGRTDGEWGHELPAGKSFVLGPQILEGHEDVEGLVLLVADGPREFIETWFTMLREQGPAGLDWEQAKQLAQVALSASRSVEPKGPVLDAAERERLRLAFESSQSAADPAWDLFGVRTFQVQCLTR